jgi:hypothetical protein
MLTATLPVVDAVTLRAMLTVSTRPPDFPVMVTVDAPLAAALVTVKVRRQLAGVAPALNDPTTPAGRPETVSVTVLENPFSGVNVRVLLPAEPCAMLSAAGAADKVNEGGRVMVSAMGVELVSAPDVPTIVTVALAAVAVLAAVNVTTLVRAAVMAPNVAVTPAGRPETANATAALKLFTGTTAMVLVPLAPAARLTLAGAAESVKLAGAATVRAMVVLLATDPDVPVTLTVETPGVAVAATLNVSVVLRVAVVAGLNVAVTPAGNPVAEKAMVPLKVPCGVTAMVLAPLPPGRTLRLAGDAARVNPFAAPTVRLMAAVLCRAPDVPVIVMTDAPATAEADAVKVSVLVPAALGALKEAVTPVGKPEAASETAPVKPF